MEQQPPNIDAKAYYGYLFDENKRPTLVMDALLRGIANYIVESIGDKEDRTLSPTKLAAFYKAVDGNYDSLFVDVPHPSISYIYQSIGCQHSLQPTTDDFAAPSIPALTARGFVRWESIETLLGPEEHVPFLQAAVRNFSLKHPDTGEPFPTDLPNEALPHKADPEIERWHSLCAEKLRQQATPDDDDEPRTRPTLPPRPDIRSGYSHLRNRSTPGRSPREQREVSDYFNSKPVAHGVSARSKTSYDPSHRTHLDPRDESPRTSRARRRSVPEGYLSPSPITTPQVSTLNAGSTLHSPEDRTRRHSHPRHRRSSVSSDTDTEAITSPHISRHSSAADKTAPPPTIRYHIPTPTAVHNKYSNIPFSYPPAHGIGHAPSPTTHHRHRGLSMPYSRERLAAYKIPIDLSGKLSAPFLRSAGVRHVDPTTGHGSGSTSSSAANSRSNSKSRAPPSGVRWGINDVNRFHRRGSTAIADSDGESDETATNEVVRERERRRKHDDLDRPRIVQRRSGSHDDRYHVREDRRDREVERRRERRRLSPDGK